MQALRRLTLKAAAAAALGLLIPLRALAAWNKNAFESKTPADALKGLGIAGASESTAIVIEAPEIAENGAVVPIEVSCNIPGTRTLSVLIEKNPFPLVGQFEFMEGALPFVKVNVKMGETSFVRVVAEAGGRWYTASREVKITIGGCGG
jgi:sulfur-oxidizing protein SoxY